MFEYALFVGPAFTLAAVSENWTSVMFDAPPIGVPAAEAWIDDASITLRATMREVYRWRVPKAVRGMLGIFTIVPVEWEGQRAVVIELRHLPGTRRPAPTFPELLASHQ